VVDVTKHFGAIAALDRCSLEVPSGAIAGLIGPNGSGKSTLIEVCTGLASQDSGSITFQGTEIGNLPPHRRAALGLRRTFQISRVWKRLAVWENLLAASPPRGRDSLGRTFLRPSAVRACEVEDRARAKDILAEVGLWHLRDSPAGELSGGQLRLLEFGRIMISGGSVALLDEPLAGINPVMGEQITQAISRMNRAGLTVVLVEHNLRVIDELCPLVFAMHQGRVIGKGSLADLAGEELFAETYMGRLKQAGN
jgi:ABC-type branched-subunit amino acid transport system ATPase component